MKLKMIVVCLAALPLMIASTAFAQTKTNKKNGGYTFTIEKEIGHTDVKDQYKSSTCWSFSTLSFLESEILRAGRPAVDLSEMFIVRNTYDIKGEKYVRMQGSLGFGPGSEFHDAINVLRTKGAVPNEVYMGMAGYNKPVQGEVDNVLKSMLDAMIKLPDGKLNPNWKAAYNGALDGYYGKTPENFDYKGKKYTPKTFATEMGINADDFIEITSFTHHPFYDKFVLEVSDNWSWGEVYNVPLNEMTAIVDNAIGNNYSIAWASDVSEFGFSFKNGLAIVHPKEKADMNTAEKDSAFTKPSPERQITQQLRQEAFDNLSTTDDHGMHMIGTAKDQTGAKYYIVKNSWGTESNDNGGYFYVSVPYFQYKTTSILVNKKAIPAEILKKLNIK